MLRNRCFSLLTKPILRYPLPSSTFSFSTLTKNFYQVLGIPQNASAAEIKTAYYKLAKQYHPDVNKGGDEAFKAISTAYETLSDDTKKRRYDDNLKYTTSSSSSTSKSYSAHTNTKTHANPNKNYKRRPYTGPENEYEEYEDDYTTDKRGQQSYQYYEEYRHYGDFHRERKYPRNEAEFRQQYSDFRNSWEQDFEATKSEEYKKQERQNSMNQQQFDTAMQEALHMLRKKIATLTIAFLLMIGAFKLLGFTSAREKNHAVFDKRTNEIFMTDRRTYSEWNKMPNKEEYPFHLDSRFVRQSKSRNFVANPGQSYYMNRPGQS